MLKGFFGWLQAEEYIFKNPAFQLKQTKVPRVILQGYKAENVEKLREACKTEREKSVFELLDSRNSVCENIFISEKFPYGPVKVRAIQLIISTIKKAAGVDERVHAHKFRRTQATHLLNSGMSLQGVQKILGHESPETTQRYAQISQENLKNEYKRLVY